MGSPFVPMRQIPPEAGYKQGDVLAVFGEIFARGYVNGLVDEAARHGLTVVRTTVGRRDENGQLRALNQDELGAQPKPFINVPLEAGFDMDPADDGTTPVAQLAGVKLGDWENATLDWTKIEQSRKRGVERFRQNVTRYLSELEKHVPKGANLLIAHTMAGGVPRAKILMPAMNRVFKGTGERHVSSETFRNSTLGKLGETNFEDVTANTFRHLLELSTPLRKKIEAEGGSVHYVAYGYHGTEALIGGEYHWHTYTSYFQGWAKMKLEDLASEAFKSGINATVYNCPEILTNSTGVFAGVEVPLYQFAAALRKEAGSNEKVKAAIARCGTLLKPEHTMDEVIALAERTLTAPEIMAVTNFAKWPQHNNRAQMETLVGASDALVDMHKDPKNQISFILSEEIFRATGYVMYHDSWKPHSPVVWLGHDVLAKTLGSGKTL